MAILPSVLRELRLSCVRWPHHILYQKLSVILCELNCLKWNVPIFIATFHTEPVACWREGRSAVPTQTSTSFTSCSPQWLRPRRSGRADGVHGDYSKCTQGTAGEPSGRKSSDWQATQHVYPYSESNCGNPRPWILRRTHRSGVWGDKQSWTGAK